jgi:hypothetical protein
MGLPRAAVVVMEERAFGEAASLAIKHADRRAVGDGVDVQVL